MLSNPSPQNKYNHMSSLKLSYGLKRYIKKSERKAKRATLYYIKLIRATMLISIFPIIVIAIMAIYGRLNIHESIIGVFAVIIGSIFFVRPYMDDLFALTQYVEDLALDNNVEMPELSFLGNVEELSSAVNNLHNSWDEKKIRLEAALAESSILFDTIPDILMMLGQDMRILRSNKAAENLFGKNIEGATFEDVVLEPVVREMVTTVLHNRHPETIEIQLKSHNIRRDFQINIENFPLFSIGGIAIVIIMHDISEAKRTRQMIKDFVANASHEIRTPLTSITGFIENLREMQEDTETRKQFLDIMYEQAERMGTLVNDLLSLSKIDMSENTMPTEHVEISELIASTIHRLDHLAEKKGMKLVYNQNKRLPEILGDENELLQVFTNLISNAIKYGYTNTDIIIATKLLKASDVTEIHIPSSANDIIAVSVEDKGEGIPSIHLPRITERFYRVDKVRAKNIGGTGLGLSIVKHIMNRHRGELRIESTEGEGSTFTVYFPVIENI